MLRVTCPRCGAETEADETKPLPSPFPFCSERCRLIDLGRWADGTYRIAGAPAPSDSVDDEAELPPEES